MKIGAVILEHRKRKGLSQRELAKQLEVSDRAISKWEQGLSTPSARHLIPLARILDIDAREWNDTPVAESAAPQGMYSVKEIYKIGRGPSSSHTIGPERACKLFLEKYSSADNFRAVLYGSLAGTGRGHGTDTVIRKTLAPHPVEVVFDNVKKDLPHPNTMDLFALKGRTELGTMRVQSVGGGYIVTDPPLAAALPILYREHTFEEIAEVCREQQMRLWQYVEAHEEPDFWQTLATVWKEMKACIRRGLCDSGELPGGLGVVKKAQSLFEAQHIDESKEVRENRLVCAYAFAVGEQNAQGETVVTAPTCGAAGVLPSVLYYYQQKNGYTDTEILHAIATAGLVGNLIKTNASISGAECGCQAEIGSACAMCAAALAELYGLGIGKIEYAAEIAIEHHLGLTCDPICGLVQIPCIERNAVAAMRAINAVSLASFLWNTRRISLDRVILAMKETGHDLGFGYRETAQAGLARIKLK